METLIFWYFSPNVIFTSKEIILAITFHEIRGRSDFSFRELTGRSGRQQREVGRLLGEVNCD
jgi:hypothetical protein